MNETKTKVLIDCDPNPTQKTTEKEKKGNDSIITFNTTPKSLESNDSNNTFDTTPKALEKALERDDSNNTLYLIIEILVSIIVVLMVIDIVLVVYYFVRKSQIEAQKSPNRPSNENQIRI